MNQMYNTPSSFQESTAESENMTAADATVSSLITNGIDTVYALPGLHNDPFFDSCYRAKNLRVIHPRHEQACGYMALGAALSTGRAQVSAVVPGPGLLNTSAAILTAEGMCAPVLTIAGQIPQADIDRKHGHLHEIRDQMGLASHIAKYTQRIKAPHEAPQVIDQAISAMFSDRPGPAVVECAMDVWARRGAVRPMPANSGVTPPAVDEDAVRLAAEVLSSASNPMIIVGGGALEASQEILALAELTGAPVLSYRRGRGVIPSDHPLAINLPIGYRLWPKVDVAVAVGTRFFVQEKQWGIDKDLKVIRIDADPEAAERLQQPAVSLVGDAAAYTGALVKRLEQSKANKSQKQDLEPHRQWFADRLTPLQPQADYLTAIRSALPRDGIFVDEVTQVGFASRLAFPVYSPRTFLSPGYQDNLGWGYGTALGAQAANPNKAVVAIAGDGGFLYQIGELATAALHSLPVVAVVFDNGMFGNVMRIQKERFGGRYIGAQLKSPDFMKVAEGFGVNGLRANSPKELEKKLGYALALREPALIHVPCGEMPSVWDMILAPRIRG